MSIKKTIDILAPEHTEYKRVPGFDGDGEFIEINPFENSTKEEIVEQIKLICVFNKKCNPKDIIEKLCLTYNLRLSDEDKKAILNSLK